MLFADIHKQSSSESVVKKAALLGEMHVRSLRQKMTLLQLTEESAKKLEVSLTCCFSLNFFFHLSSVKKFVSRNYVGGLG
jgi:hypothetical protein